MIKSKAQKKVLVGFSILLAIALVLPVSFSTAQEDVQMNQLKFGRLLRLVEGYYVDSADVNKLTEDAIINLLSELDPHSTYISKEEVERMNEPLKGNFEGVGITFNIYKDTLLVTTTIPGGPSEKVGLRAGDRIMEVDGKNIAGIGLKNSDVFDMLRGDKGTEVNLKVLRKTEPGLLAFSIIRDKIPIYSLDASYMMNKNTGYIKLNRFSATSNEEFETAMKELQQEGIKNLVLDLRGNGGGYLKSAIEIADQFLENRKLIVYTDGRNDPKREYEAGESGMFEKGKLVVLVDEGSASASEIVSGAIQDWDRGLIVGRRSFGKGLVQKPFFLTDGSMVQLTTAHYYTPSGRCIQKSYDEGLTEYRRDYANRMSNGEMFSADSIRFDEELKHKTLVNGRNVYGGGGVMPDIFVPLDTSHHYSYLNQLRAKNITYNYVLDFVDENRDRLTSDFPSFESFYKNFSISDETIEEIAVRGEKEGIERNDESLAFAKSRLQEELKALIARDVFSRNDMYKILNADDEVILKALEIIVDSKEYDDLLVTKE